MAGGIGLRNIERSLLRKECSHIDRLTPTYVAAKFFVILNTSEIRKRLKQFDAKHGAFHANIRKMVTCEHAGKHINERASGPCNRQGP